MRLYAFTNMYLSDIQKGIQTAHLVHELMLEYPASDSMTLDWAHNHKTIIVMNGGYMSKLDELSEVLEATDYESTYFAESQEALGGARTVVGVVLPEKIYVAAQLIRNREIFLNDIDGKFIPERMDSELDDPEMEELLDSFGTYKQNEVELITELNKYRLA